MDWRREIAGWDCLVNGYIYGDLMVAARPARPALETHERGAAWSSLDTLFLDFSVVENTDYHSLYDAVDIMVGNYEMYALPLYDSASDIQLNFEKNVKAVLKSAHNQYLKRVNEGEDSDSVLHELTAASLRELRSLSAQ